MIAWAYDGLPDEACGLMVGIIDPATPAGDDGGVAAPERITVTDFVPCTNVAASAKVYEIAPKELLRAELDADDDGLVVLGVMHSHTHTEPYPSPTDVRQAPDPAWHYVIVSLKRDSPETRSYKIVGESVSEEPIEVFGR
jgi:[CysO sulfur-carrier protein]-S-L-cysteine hydrolase